MSSPVAHLSPPVVAKSSTTLLELPKRNRGNLQNELKTEKIQTNLFRVTVRPPIEQIYICSVRFEPRIPSNNSTLQMSILRDLNEQIRQQIRDPVVSGLNIYSTSEPNPKERDYESGKYTVRIKFVKSYNLLADHSLLKLFLNNALKKIMADLDYV